MTLRLALALLAASAGAAHAQDLFGIPMGGPASQLGAKPFKPGWYQVTPPQPDPQFEKFAVEAYRATGVCVIQGVSALIVADPEGVKVRAAIDRLAEAYSPALGAPEKLDTCRSMICAPEFWGVDMATGERRYGYRWRIKSGGALKKVREVSVVALARSASSFTYLVEYQSDAVTACTTQELAAGGG